jgi:hypothetical protein
MPSHEEDLKKRKAAREVVDVLEEISLLLVCAIIESFARDISNQP